MAEGRIGPGAFVAVVGPSGAGKDTLIGYARARFAGRSDIVFVRRVVTRPCDDGLEPHDSLSEAEFGEHLRRGGFALHWRAHGLCYGLPADFETTIQAGGVAIANVSRSVIPELRARYARLIVLLVTAPPEVLAARLKRRGRESDTDIAERLRRTSENTVGHPDVVVTNEGDLSWAGEAFARAVQDAVARVSDVN